MLGLGSSLLFGGKVQRLIFEYTSDFTSGVDSWEKWTQTQGTPTISGNDSGPDGAGGWLKMVFDQNQTSTSGLKRDLGWTGREGTAEMQETKKGDYAEISFKIHLVETGSDHWGGSDNVSIIVSALGDGEGGLYDSGDQFNTQIGGSGGIVQNQTTSISLNRYALFQTTDGSYIDDVRILFKQTGDKPANGAVFYIKDYNIKIYR